MQRNSLEAAVGSISKAWGPLDGALVDHCRNEMERLAAAKQAEDWLARLRHERPASAELYRDPAHGFVLQAHTEEHGVYRAPHDHGRSWVIYAVAEGAMEMGTYARIPGEGGETRLVRRDSALLTAGMAQIYWPGDVHDTLCIGGPALLLRLTERDLRREKDAGWMTRFVERGGAWTAAPAREKA